MANGTVMLILGYLEARNSITFEDGVLSIQKLKIYCVYTVVRNQIVDKRWLFDLNRFYRMGVYALRERVFCAFLVSWVVRRGVDLYCNSLSRFFSTSLLYILYLLIKNK